MLTLSCLVHAEGASVSCLPCGVSAGGTHCACSCTSPLLPNRHRCAQMCTGCCPRLLLSPRGGSWGKLCASHNPGGPTDGCPCAAPWHGPTHGDSCACIWAAVHTQLFRACSSPVALHKPTKYVFLHTSCKREQLLHCSYRAGDP